MMYSCFAAYFIVIMYSCFAAYFHHMHFVSEGKLKNNQLLPYPTRGHEHGVENKVISFTFFLNILLTAKCSTPKEKIRKRKDSTSQETSSMSS